MTVRDRILDEATRCLGAGGPDPWATEMGILRALPSTSWCAIWVRAIWRRAGLAVPNWVIGDGNVRGLVQTRDPQPGDLVCWRGRTGHQSIFVRLDGSIVVTIDGNTTANGVSGIVAQKRRPVADVLAYYSAPVETCLPKA